MVGHVWEHGKDPSGNLDKNFMIANDIGSDPVFRLIRFGEPMIIRIHDVKGTGFLGGISGRMIRYINHGERTMSFGLAQIHANNDFSNKDVW